MADFLKKGYKTLFYKDWFVKKGKMRRRVIKCPGAKKSKVQKWWKKYKIWKTFSNTVWLGVSKKVPFFDQKNAWTEGKNGKS